MLTKDEINKLEEEIWNLDWMDDTERETNMKFARAIEAAVMAKLKQQEPVGYFYFDDGQWRQAFDPISFNGCTKLFAAPVQQEHIYTDNKQTLVNALSRIDELEAQNKQLLEAAKLVIAWYEAEDDHSKADFYQRLEMCRVSESALRAAIAATGEQDA